jgi:hypothetical protein
MENNTVKQSQILLAELDQLISKDYDDALQLIALFKQETDLLREHNQLSDQEFFELSENLDIFVSEDSDELAIH